MDTLGFLRTLANLAGLHWKCRSTVRESVSPSFFYPLLLTLLSSGARSDHKVGAREVLCLGFTHVDVTRVNRRFTRVYVSSIYTHIESAYIRVVLRTSRADHASSCQ